MKLHLKRFDRIKRKTASALRLFTVTQKRLQRQQDRLKAAIDEMEAEALKLLHLRDAAQRHHDAQGAVLANIETIVNGTSVATPKQ